MNVIISNLRNAELTSLDVDVIKSVSGVFEVDELVSMFKTFFCERLIIDVTSIKNYKDVNSVERLAMGLGSEKIILLLTDELCSSKYLNSLIEIGLYNFTNNINAIKRLIARPNTYEDVAKLQQQEVISEEVEEQEEDYIDECKIIGIKNVTEGAGSTTLTYMLLKQVKKYFGSGCYALELDKEDFKYFNNKDMISISEDDLESKVRELSGANVIIVDLNETRDYAICTDVIYLLEPSTIKLNKLIRKDRNVFEKLKGKKIVLNKSLLSNKDVTEFEYESNSKIFYNIPSLDERVHNEVLNDFLSRIGVLDITGARKEDGNKIFGIFKH